MTSTGAPDPDPRPYVFTRPLRPLGRLLLVLLLLQLVGNVVLLVAGYGEISLLDRIQADVTRVSQDDVDRADRFFGTTIFALLLLTAVTAVVFVVWTYRARRNVEEWQPQLQRHGRGWAIGGWLCPVLDLWIPYQVLRDIWDDTERRGDDLTRRPRPVLLAWWVLLVLNAPVLLVAYSIGGAQDRSRDDYTLALGAAAVALMSLVLAVLVVQGLTRAQDRRRALAYADFRAAAR